MRLLFGNVESGKMRLNGVGRIIQLQIENINHENNVIVDKYVIMPNHIHLLIFLRSDEMCFVDIPKKSLKDIRELSKAQISKLIQQFKAKVSWCIGKKIWHSRYYDHIVRNKKEYEMIYNYIENNPMNWKKDCYNEERKIGQHEC